MNTTLKGDLFEDKVYNILKEQLAQDKFIISANHYLLLKKNSYYSKDREKSIIFDLAVEFYREGAEKPNIIVLIECKDLGRPVSIDDVEGIYIRKEQVAKANSKCLLFTTSHLQESAFNYATNVGIGVVRIFDEDSMSWLVERSDKNLVTSSSNTLMINVINALTNEFFITTYHNTFAYFNHKPSLSVEDIILQVLEDNSSA